MKEKSIKALKIVLIIFGVLFMIQILLFCLIMIGASNFSSAKTFDFDIIDNDFNKVQTSSKPKEMLPVIKYAEDYHAENKKYPEKVEAEKIKNNKIKSDYKYEATKDGNCYTVTIEENNRTKQYQHCKTASDNSSSTSESYVEYTK